MTNFVHLAGRSQHSPNGFSTPTELVAAAAAHGQQALALTDTNLAGALVFRRAAHEAGIKPIIGLSIRVVSGGEHLTEIALLAESSRGWRNLVAINNIAHEAGNHHRQVDYSQLREHSAGLIAITTPHAENDLLSQIFDRDHLFMAANTPDFPSKFPEAALEFATRILALPDYRHVAQDDSEAAERLTVIRSNGDRESDAGSWVSGENDVLSAAPDSFAWRSAVQLTATVAASIQDDVIPAPGRYVPGPKDADDIVAELAASGAARIFGDEDGNIPLEVSRRLRHEMKAIERTGSSRSILAVEELLSFCAKEGIQTSSRGTSSGSLVLHCLGITHVNPLKYGLVMERLLRPDRDELIRIDIDIDRNRRQEVEDWLALRHPGRTARVGTRILYTESSIARAVRSARPSPTLKALVGRIRNTVVNPTGFLISDEPLGDAVPTWNRGKDETPVTHWSCDELARQGHLVIHLVGANALADVGTVLKGAEDALGREVIIPEPWDDHPSAHRTWRMIGNGDTNGVFLLKNRQAECHRHKPGSINELAAFVALFGRQTDTEPYVSARRDGGIPARMEEAGYGSEVVNDILSSTHGCILYQEQIIELLTQMGGLSRNEAHAGWVSLAKKRTHEVIELRRAFTTPTLQDDPSLEPGWDTGEPLADWLFERIAEAAPTAFAASHAYAYARTIFRSAWVKANWPMLFDEAVL